jgi:hypothetical protein
VVLMEMVVKNADRAPIGTVLRLAVDGLLVGFVRLSKVAADHIRPTEKIPTKGVGRVVLETRGQNSDCAVGVVKGSPTAMVEPTKLLENLGMSRICLEDAFVSVFGGIIIVLLLVHMTDLEPNIDLCERMRGVVEDVGEAIERRLGVLLLLVDYPESEINFVGLFEI